MNYPLISEYIEAIKAAEDNFEQLKNLRPVLGEDGAPVMTSGGFAVVFKMKDEQTGKFHAVKCFLKDQEGRAEAYRMIAEELEFVNSTFLTPIKYLDKELFVDTKQTDETEFPVLLMDWVEGVTLDKYIRENIYDEYALSMLAYQFSRLAMWMIPQPFAHGDLKPDNILVKNDGSLVLVDYDGMYVPTMKGQNARELGSPDFRHPCRTETDFDEHIDDFSLASILLSLKAIALQPERLDEYGASDRLLFSEKDYRNVSQCELLKALLPSDDSELNVLTSLFMIALEKKNLSNVSFRLFDLCRPKESVHLNLSSVVTEEDLADVWTDEFGVVYSKDRKRLLNCKSKYFSSKEYFVKVGTFVICDGAFYSCSSLSKIFIPDSVTSIGVKAFSGCNSLSEIHIPDSVTKIGIWAFSSCSSLSEIHIPYSVTEIGIGAFSGCDSLSEIHIPNSVTKIGDCAFSGCSSLSEIHIPNSVTKIGSWTFNCCSSLSGIHIPNSVTKIGDCAFRNCSSLTKIYIPDSVTSIGDGAFLFCNSLLQINIPSSVNHIGSHVFDNCDSLSQIIIPFGTLEKYTEILPFPPKIYKEKFDDSFLFYTKGAYLLGRKYFEGLEVEIDYNKAIDWFNRAITSGCSSAYPYLATCYRQGLGVEKNEKIADCYFEKAGEIDFLDIVHFFYEISNYEYCLLLLKIWRTKLEDEGFQNSYGNMRRGHRRYTFYKERLTEKGYKID